MLFVSWLFLVPGLLLLSETWPASSIAVPTAPSVRVRVAGIVIRAPSITVWPIVTPWPIAVIMAPITAPAPIPTGVTAPVMRNLLVVVSHLSALEVNLKHTAGKRVSVMH